MPPLDNTLSIEEFYDRIHNKKPTSSEDGYQLSLLRVTEANSSTDEALSLGWKNPIFLVESDKLSEADS